MSGIYKYVVEMGSGTMIYIPSFIKTGSGVQKITGGIHRHTDNMVSHNPDFIFQNKECILKKVKLSLGFTN
jgi:hypothetical protein